MAMAQQIASPTAYFELSFCPSLALVSTVRRFVATFYENVLADPDVTSRVALAAHELLENAVKYSIDGETNIRVDVTPEPNNILHICIRTRNLSTPEHIELLRGYFSDMKKMPDPLLFYTDLMARKAKTNVGSGLGLGRIAAEAELALDLVVEGNMVEIRATADVPGGVA
ncbi:MAG: hypothetical protein H0T79_04235 [Deltaproteobacteria bacterium]|nr:hypothetical protein [Deltaproteobacteria bacterium]